jgi:diguanylate cyclase (GGDEF)-like protein
VSKAKCSLLIVDDEPYILPTLSALLSNDFEVLTAGSADAAQEVFSLRPIDLVLTDQKMPRRTGVQLLEWVRQHHPHTVRLLMTGYAELDDAVEAINRGNVYYYLLKPWRTEELLQILRNAAEKFSLERNQEQLLAELRRLNHELENRVIERTQALETANRLLQQRTRELEDANTLLQQRTRELERLVLIDPLTGLFNRRAMDSLALAEIKRHNRYQNPLALGLLDVDHFKRVNTDFDLPGGDEVLKGLARILTGTLREVDSVGRVGGEEFLIIGRETSLEGASGLAERIRAMVADTPIAYQHHHISITVSLGFAVVEGQVEVEYQQMYAVAASALSNAKRLGRNCFIVRALETPAGNPTATP